MRDNDQKFDTSPAGRRITTCTKLMLDNGISSMVIVEQGDNGIAEQTDAKNTNNIL